jgi:hypothetical protein
MECCGVLDTSDLCIPGSNPYRNMYPKSVKEKFALYLGQKLNLLKSTFSAIVNITLVTKT